MLLSACIAFLLAVNNLAAYSAELPNVVFILTDDLGYYSPGFKNPDLKTPTIDKLARNGLFLQEHYTYQFCSPSRGSLMTGRYPFKLSSTRTNLNSEELDGIDLRFEMLPKKLKRAGYASHHVGKWHMGYCDKRLAPQSRGFQTTNGFFSAAQDHFDQGIGYCPTDNGSNIAISDIWVNGAVQPDLQGIYNDLRFSEAAVEIILQQQAEPFFLYLALSNTHSPLQAPEAFLTFYENISYSPQKKFYAMVSVVDKVVEDVVAALHATGVWENTLLVWTTDNGSPVISGSNWPLRGLKRSLWEGGTRTPAIVSGGLLPASQAGKSKHGLIHMADWYATILGLAGLPTQDATGPSPSDGIDMWPWLSGEVAASPRHIVVYDHRLYEGPPATGAIRVGNHKMLIGPQSSASWYGGASNNYFNNNISDPNPSTNFTACAHSVCLFDLSIDPTEHNDVADERPEVVAALLEVWDRLSQEYHPPRTAPIWVDGFCKAAVASGGFLVPYTVLPPEEPCDVCSCDCSCVSDCFFHSGLDSARARVVG